MLILPLRVSSALIKLARSTNCRRAHWGPSRSRPRWQQDRWRLDFAHRYIHVNEMRMCWQADAVVGDPTRTITVAFIIDLCFENEEPSKGTRCSVWFIYLLSPTDSMFEYECHQNSDGALNLVLSLWFVLRRGLVCLRRPAIHCLSFPVASFVFRLN